MLDHGFRPDVKTFTSMIDACVKMKTFDFLRFCVTLMRIMGIEPNEHTFTCCPVLKEEK